MRTQRFDFLRKKPSSEERQTTLTFNKFQLLLSCFYVK